MRSLSRVRVAAKDEHSGIRKISFRFLVNGNGEEKGKRELFLEPQVPLCPEPRVIFKR